MLETWNGKPQSFGACWKEWPNFILPRLWRRWNLWLLYSFHLRIYYTTFIQTCIQVYLLAMWHVCLQCGSWFMQLQIIHLCLCSKILGHLSHVNIHFYENYQSDPLLLNSRICYFDDLLAERKCSSEFMHLCVWLREFFSWTSGTHKWACLTKFRALKK